MTVVVGVAAPDGIILGAESRTTLVFEHMRHRILSDTAQKLFPIGGVGIATYGDALLGSRTIAGLMDEFVAQLDGEPGDADSMAGALGDFFDQRFREHSEPT